MTSHALSRRFVLTSALAMAAAGTLAACSAGTAAQKAQSTAASAGGAGALTLGMSYTPNVQFAPFYMAAAQGLYSHVTLRHHGAQEGLFDALLAGTEDLVVAGADEAAVAASGGKDLVIVGGYYQTYPGCLIVPEASSISSLADLRGKTVGLPGKFGESWFTLQVALQSAGLTESDLTIAEIGYTQQAALVAGKVDAIVGFSNNDAVQIADAGTPVRTLAIADSVPLVGASLVTTGATLASAREALEAAVAASAKGMEAFVKDPSAGVEAAKQYVTDLADPTQAARALKVAQATAALIKAPSGTKVGAVTVESIATMLDFLSSGRLLEGGFALKANTLCQPLI